MEYSWKVMMEDLAAASRAVKFDSNDDVTRPSSPERPPTAAHLVRPGSARPNTATSSLISDSGYTPFTMEPENGVVAPGKKVTVTVKFSPLDVQEYEARLICTIPNLEEGSHGPVIGVRARSNMPYAHLDLVESDYVKGARRNPELRGPHGAPPGTTLDPNIRVIEMHNVGIGVRSTRTFSVVNPTTQAYSFRWENEDDGNTTGTREFRCLTTSGVIRPGKKAEMSFEFRSTSLELVESFWRFHIEEHGISVPFLLVGTTNDPNISLDRSHVNFRSLLIGHEASQEVFIINEEETSFPFFFVESSLHTPGFSNSVRVSPMSGVLPPKSRTPVSVSFTPKSEKEVNFNLVCDVKRRTLPLGLNVKAEGYSMNCLVLYEDLTGAKVELNPKETNLIDLGEVELNETAFRNIYVVNSGKFNFDYTWEVRGGAGHSAMGSKSSSSSVSKARSSVTMSPLQGGVDHGNRAKCTLSFCPTRPVSLHGCQLVLKVSNGPTYHVAVAGHGSPPGMHFSFTRHDFRHVFVHRAGMPVQTAELQLTNKDSKEISVDCLYTPTPQLSHDFEAKVLAPNETYTVKFSFYPREAKKYHEQVSFEINGLSKRSVDFYGHGTDMKVEVAHARDRVVRLGALRVGQTVKKVIPVVNNSPAPITFRLAVTPQQQALMDGRVLKVSPYEEITLAPKGGTVKVEIIFSPRQRIPQFSEEVTMECSGMFAPLFLLQGSCQGIHIHLDTDAIPFGTVVERSTSTRAIMLVNSGDIGARFRWALDREVTQDFSVNPMEGYISPGMTVPLEVTFHPQKQKKDIRYDTPKCRVEGAPKPLKLTLTGMCIPVTPTKEVVNFTAQVRQKDTRNVLVTNKTTMHCNLRPVIEGEQWTGGETFILEPQQTKPYEVTYRPLTMTNEGKKHSGSVFFPIPDGTGLMFTLIGTSEHPKAQAKISRDVPCKTLHTEFLPVTNWLKKPQRFKVKWEYLKPEKLDAGTTVKGLHYIDVPGNGKRDYKVAFYAHREGQSTIKVIFENESSGEYQFYELTFRAQRPGSISTISLTTPVRQRTDHTVQLENPLGTSVTFQASCSVNEVLMPSQLMVPAHSKGEFSLEYLPLKVGTQDGKLEFQCNDLGLYMYDLKLNATPAGPERALYFRAALGTNQSQTARFMNFAKQKTDYSCRVDNPDFHVDNKNVAAAPGSASGTEVALEVIYEPSHLGESRGLLTMTSEAGGVYTFPLFGVCVEPKPQGPFTVKQGATTSITFRNVFPGTTAFNFQVDNPLFHVAKPGDNIRSRKDHRIVVGFDGNDSGSKAPVVGKLIVSCAKSAGGSSSAQWVYYLKGVPDERLK